MEIVVSVSSAHQSEIEWQTSTGGPPAHFYSANELCGQAEGKEVWLSLREAGAYLKYSIERYESLPDVAAFVHEDVEVHNPVWRRWLSCLRSGIDTASLSPVLFKQPAIRHTRLGALAKRLGLATRSNNGASTCCLLVAQGREEIRSLPLHALQSILESLRNGTVDAWDHEFEFHTLYQPSKQGANAELAGLWRDPCEHFKCEDPSCGSKYIRYIRSDGSPFVSGRPKKVVDSKLMTWEEDACGVSNLSMPESRRLARVVEVIPARSEVLGPVRESLGPG